MAESSGGEDPLQDGGHQQHQQSSNPKDLQFKKRRRITLKDMRQPATEVDPPQEELTDSCDSNETMKRRLSKSRFKPCPVSDDSSEDIPMTIGNDEELRDSNDVIDGENETAPILQKTPSPEQSERRLSQRQRKPCLKVQTQSLPTTLDTDIETGNSQNVPATDSNGRIPSNQSGQVVVASGISEKFRNKYVIPAFARTNSAGASSETSTRAETGCNWTRWLCRVCLRKKQTPRSEDDIYFEEDPFKKRCMRACLTFVYILLALIAGVVTYSMIQDLMTAMNHPVRSIHLQKVDTYEAPGIAVYPGGAEFLACGHYYNNVVTSKVRLEDLDLKNHNCSYTHLEYIDPHDNVTPREVFVIRGPTSFVKREAIFLHFALEDETRDFFTVSYFVFPKFDVFNSSDDPVSILTEYHQYMPTFALSSELRMWIKLIMSEANMEDGTRTDFRVEYSVVKFFDDRTQEEKKKHLFFIFFEWKNNIIEQSTLIHTMTPWSIGAGLCGVFLTLHRGYQLAQVGYKRVQKDKARRSIRKRTIRELQSQQSIQRDVKQRRLSRVRQNTMA